jgi:uncharacterized membrane protein
MSDERISADPSGRSRLRIDALSDAVFAIALTLLTLTINFTQEPHQTFGRSFRDTLPQIWAFVLSFAVVALFWIAHHRFFAMIEFADHGLVVDNFVYLGIIALVPFPTEVLGDYPDETGAVVLYASVLALGSLASAFLWEYARRRALLKQSTPEQVVSHSIARGVTTAAVFALSIPIALFVSRQLAEAFWILIVVTRLALRRHYGPLHDVIW